MTLASKHVDLAILNNRILCLSSPFSYPLFLQWSDAEIFFVCLFVYVMPRAWLNQWKVICSRGPPKPAFLILSHPELITCMWLGLNTNWMWEHSAESELKKEKYWGRFSCWFFFFSHLIHFGMNLHSNATSDLFSRSTAKLTWQSLKGNA